MSVTGGRGGRIWPAGPGGVAPGFAAHEVAEARHRPDTSGEPSDTVVEIAGVAVGHFPVRRLYLLDAQGRHLTMVPARGMSEEDILQLVDQAGLGYRAYSLQTAWLDPEALCEALFPRSTRSWRALVAEDDVVAGWWP